MSLRKKFIKDNTGSSLAMVIISIAFLAILASLVINVTMTNYKTKITNRSSKVNFYDAESALKEIHTRLDEKALDAAAGANEAALGFYTKKTEQEEEALYAGSFLDSLNTSLGLNGNKADVFYNKDLLKSFVTNRGITITTADSLNLIVRKDMDGTKPLSTDNIPKLTLKNVSIRYTDASGYTTSLTTDIVITAPIIRTGAALAGGPEFANYSLIADKKLTADTTAMTGVSGSIYAGENGINLLNGAELNLSGGEKIITRGDITVSERGSLTVSGGPGVWAQNISALKGSGTDMVTTIDITGNCYIGNDLVLGAKNSKVTVKGKYYGYSYQKNAGMGTEPSSSSAIIINGRNSDLDLSGTESLFLAGRAYLNAESADNTATDSQSLVQTGEALAVKSNQYAYLVPKEFLWCSTNPVSSTVYGSRPANPQAEVDFSKSSDTLGTMNIKDYADGFLKVFYQPSGSGSQKMVYYYLKFKSEDAANRYLRDYYNANNTGTTGIIDERIGAYGKSIRLNNDLTTILSDGNLFTFNAAAKKSGLIANTVNTEAPASAGCQSLVETKQALTKKYEALKVSLREDSTAVSYDSNSMFNSLIDTRKLSAVSNAEGGTRMELAGGYTVTIVNNASKAPYVLTADARYAGNGLKGIVIASGNVKVQANFTGLILSGGEISLGSGVTVTASNETVINILRQKKEEINNCFRNLVLPESNSAAGSAAGEGQLIYYENWKKN